jgi:hypothetical protein
LVLATVVLLPASIGRMTWRDFATKLMGLER